MTLISLFEPQLALIKFVMEPVDHVIQMIVGGSPFAEQTPQLADLSIPRIIGHASKLSLYLKMRAGENMRDGKQLRQGKATDRDVTPL